MNLTDVVGYFKGLSAADRKAQLDALNAVLVDAPKPEKAARRGGRRRGLRKEAASEALAEAAIS